MDKIDQFKLYDTILGYVGRKTPGLITLSSYDLSDFGTLLRTGGGIPIDDFDNAVEYLVGTNHLIRINGYYSLDIKGRERLVHSFESEYLESERYKSLQLQNLQETTTLAIAQQKDIRRARLRSWWAIGISILAIFVAVFSAYQEYVHSKQEEEKNKLIQENSKNPLHDSIKRTLN